MVLAGANPGAKIENVMAHGELDEESATIWNGVTEFNYDVDIDVDSISHADAPKAEAEKEKSPEEGKEETIADVYNTLTDKQKMVVNALIGAALEEKAENDDQEEDEKMKHNAFEQTNEIETNVLSHSDLVDVIADAKKFGSLKDAYIAKCNEKEVDLQHSINNLDVLFPEVKAINNTPVTINDDTNWVAKVMGGVHHTPFSRVKMMAFDITGEEARARGYIKGNKKEEEVIGALRRETSPQTVYKLQKLDRDDIVDVTDFDVVAYIKNEMRGKLDEEIARAVLIGDGRSSASKDKINPLHIRPILGDDPTYVVSKQLKRNASEDEYAFAKQFIKAVIKSRKEYKGKGKPTLFCTEDLLTDMLLIEDRNQRVVYDTIDKLKTALLVVDIVTVPCFDNQIRKVGEQNLKLMAILVNLSDYNIGADKGGAVSMFDDFDINFNKYEYLIETRCSGAMVQPYGAVTFEEQVAAEEAGV